MKSKAWFVPFCTVMLLLAIEVVSCSIVLLSPASAQVARSNLSITLQPTTDGWWTRYRNFAAEEWRTDTPERADGAVDAATGKRVLKWKMIAEYPGGKHQYVWYYGGGFWSESGGKQGSPSRWAYMRLVEDSFDGHAWKLADGTAPMPSKIPLDGTILQLREVYTKKQVMDSMDKYQWADGVGAPEQ